MSRVRPRRPANRGQFRQRRYYRGQSGAFKAGKLISASGRSLSAKLLGAAGMVTMAGVVISLGLPEWLILPAILIGAAVGYFAIYNRGWRKWLRDRKHHKPVEFETRTMRKLRIKKQVILGAGVMFTTFVVGMGFVWLTPTRADVPQLAGDDIFRCNVTRVIDGDTFDCLQGQRVRLHAIAARERDGTCSPGHPCPSASAEAATAKLRDLTGWGTLHCKPTGTTYGRVAAICMNSKGVEINCAMAQSGTALRWARYERAEAICSGRYGTVR